MPVNRIIKLSLCATLLGSAFSFMAPVANAAEQWYFHVDNDSDSRIVKLEVSENRKSWGYFDIGRGIAPGTSAKLTWDASTNDEGCKQWVRAKFADGSSSEPARIDFCKDLDEPIVFE